MTRFIMFVIVTVLSIFSLFGCGSTLSQVEPRSSGFASLDEEGPPAVVESARRERTMLAGRIGDACDTHRARYVHRPVSTRDGMRVYCF